MAEKFRRYGFKGFSIDKKYSMFFYYDGSGKTQSGIDYCLTRYEGKFFDKKDSIIFINRCYYKMTMYLPDDSSGMIPTQFVLKHKFDSLEIGYKKSSKSFIFRNEEYILSSRARIKYKKVVSKQKGGHL